MNKDYESNVPVFLSIFVDPWPPPLDAIRIEFFEF